MISISKALKIISRETFALRFETVDLENSVGRVLAETIEADTDLPPFDRSQMDGFAVKTGDIKNAPVRLKIVGESIAGKGFDEKLNYGESVRIMTGARVPDGADAVQKVELTKEMNGYVEITEPTKQKQNIVERGEEIKKGAKVYESGEIVSENMIASPASFGYARLKVSRQPKVTILATGSEIVDINQAPERDQIRNSNSVMLKVLAEKVGAKTEMLPLIHDNLESLKNIIAEAVGLKTKNQKPKTQAQILILTGGVSVGDYDFTKPALRELGAEIFFEKVSLKPGKPTVFAKLNDVLIFGLPGNPVSVAVTFYLFVRTAILQMQGAQNCELRRGFAVASGRIKGTKERECFLPVSVATNDKGQLIIESLRFSSSSNFIAFSRANALAFVPEGVIFEQGDVVKVLFLN